MKKVGRPQAGGKSGKVSDMLASESKKMEEKLGLVKKMMELEKNNRSQAEKSKDGKEMWRAANKKGAAQTQASKNFVGSLSSKNLGGQQSDKIVTNLNENIQK